MINVRKSDGRIKASKIIVNNNDSKKVVYNYSEVNSPDYVSSVVSLSPKFGVELDRTEVPIPTIIKDLEFGVSWIKVQGADAKELERVKNNVRSSALNSIKNLYNSGGKSSKYRANVCLKKDPMNTKKFLSEHKDLLIMRADKGGATVLINETDYKNTTTELVNDPVVYKKVKSDPTNKYQDLIHRSVKKMVNDGIIDKLEAKSFSTRNAVPPRLYGLRKVHKTGCKMRPVVSWIQTPCYKLASFLHLILVPVVDTFSFNVRNSTELVELLEKTRLPDNYILVSLDVVSLFTTIPNELVSATIEEYWEDFKNMAKVPKETLIELVNICFSTSYFTSYNDILYNWMGLLWRIR